MDEPLGGPHRRHRRHLRPLDLSLARSQSLGLARSSGLGLARSLGLDLAGPRGLDITGSRCFWLPRPTPWELGGPERPTGRDPAAWVGGLGPRGRSVPRWVGRNRLGRDLRRRKRATGRPLTASGPSRPSRRCFGSPRRRVRRRWGRHRLTSGLHRRAPRPPGPDPTRWWSFRTPGNLRTQVAGVARRAGHLRGRGGSSRGAIGRPVRGRCRPRRRRAPRPGGPPILAGRDLRRIGPEPARRRGRRPLGPGSTSGRRCRSVRAWTPISRVPTGCGRRPILRRLVNN